MSYKCKSAKRQRVILKGGKYKCLLVIDGKNGHANFVAIKQINKQIYAEPNPAWPLKKIHNYCIIKLRCMSETSFACNTVDTVDRNIKRMTQM